MSISRAKGLTVQVTTFGAGGGTVYMHVTVIFYDHASDFHESYNARPIYTLSDCVTDIILVN